MSKGALFIIGGNENKENDAELLSKFVGLSLLRKGGIGIIPTASQIPDQVGLQYKKLFQRLGAEQVKVINVRSREQAEETKLEEIVSRFSAVFMTGGDQTRLTKVIGGTRLLDVLFKKWESGMLIAGTSAGASVMGKKMVVAANINTNEEHLNAEVRAGFGFLENVIIDQHFSQRKRFNRLLDAVSENRRMIGIGIDENTAILLRDDMFTVYGEHQVIVMDAKKQDFARSALSDGRGMGLTASGLQLHTLTKGYSFDLSSRKLLNRKEE